MLTSEQASACGGFGLTRMASNSHSIADTSRLECRAAPREQPAKGREGTPWRALFQPFAGGGCGLTVSDETETFKQIRFFSCAEKHPVACNPSVVRPAAMPLGAQTEINVA